jgi:hypothetical protein
LLIPDSLSWPDHGKPQSQGDLQTEASHPGEEAGIQLRFYGFSVWKKSVDEFGQEKIGRSIILCRKWQGIFTA